MRERSAELLATTDRLGDVKVLIAGEPAISQYGRLRLLRRGDQPGHPRPACDGQARVRRGARVLPGRHRDGGLIDRIFAEHPDIGAVITARR